MILFRDIFARAVKLFNDPDIQLMYVNNKVSFDKTMRPYLISGMNRFTNPTLITYRLSAYTDPMGVEELIEGTGANSYTLTSTPVDNSDFYFAIDGVPAPTATYNAEDNTVTFDVPVVVGSTATVQWYYAGEYSIELSNLMSGYIPPALLTNRIMDILARCMVIEWGSDNLVNVYTEITNILTDTDFKLHAPSAAIKAKIDWHDYLVRELDNMMTKLNWDILTTAPRGSNFGKQ